MSLQMEMEKYGRLRSITTQTVLVVSWSSSSLIRSFYILENTDMKTWNIEVKSTKVYRITVQTEDDVTQREVLSDPLDYPIIDEDFVDEKQTFKLLGEDE